MRPITGTGHDQMAYSMSAKPCASARFCSHVYSSIARIHDRSAPAQNALPWPPRTTARSESSVAKPAKAAVSSAMTLSLNALRTSGRLRNTRATAPSRLICKVAAIELSDLHAEHAELHGRNRRVEAGAQAQRQHAARVGRVDH